MPIKPEHTLGSKRKGTFSSSYIQEFSEEINVDNLAKEALAKTIREGGAFARENSNQFRQ